MGRKKWIVLLMEPRGSWNGDRGRDPDHSSRSRIRFLRISIGQESRGFEWKSRAFDWTRSSSSSVKSAGILGAIGHENDRSLYPPRLIKTIILNNPFSDIIPRIIVQESEEVKDNSKTETTAGKDFNLLSFGEEAEEDEEESVILNKKFSDKDKSAYDHLTDPKLSSQPAVEPPGLVNKKRKEDHNRD
ncbi:Peptidyl-prolyl isomerase cwc27 [Eufriesea mexicana]|uniref:Peptidyl-prolyl isomerase cwc27 n=1 Tax=Eufriesea mexicana TaxID=516756 RepID=A0A310S9R1_9HYME|nr:Peptidyl-prolyl isomerase cwc27 [Eufriesea mexicana]